MTASPSEDAIVLANLLLSAAEIGLLTAAPAMRLIPVLALPT